MANFRVKDGKEEKEIFCRYIVRKGKRIYPKKAKFFRFWVPVDKTA